MVVNARAFERGLADAQCLKRCAGLAVEAQDPQPALGLLLAGTREGDRGRRHAQYEGRVEIGGRVLSHSATSWVRARARARSGATLSCMIDPRGRSPPRSIFRSALPCSAATVRAR